MLDKANLLCIAAKSGKPKLKQLQWTQKNKPISTCLIKFQTNNDRTEIINLACPCSTVLLLIGRIHVGASHTGQWTPTIHREFQSSEKAGLLDACRLDGPWIVP